jgi:hypothetical protein
MDETVLKFLMCYPHNMIDEYECTTCTFLNEMCFFYRLFFSQVGNVKTSIHKKIE